MPAQNERISELAEGAPALPTDNGWFQRGGTNVALSIEAVSLAADKVIQGDDGLRVYDDFYRSDRALDGDTCPTGQVWTVAGQGTDKARIAGNKLVTTGDGDTPGNVYCCLPFGRAISRIMAAFSIVSGGGADILGNTILTLFGGVAADVLTMWHLQISAGGWSLDKRLNSAWTMAVISGKHSIRTDGTIYSIGMEFAAGVVTVITPEGARYTYTDIDPPGDWITPTWGILQLGNDTGSHTYWDVDFRARWHGIDMRDKSVMAQTAIDGAVPSAELEFLHGVAGARHQHLRFTTPATVGWYRISTAAALGSWACAGRLVITASHSVGGQIITVDADVYRTTDPPRLNLVSGLRRQIITQVRASNDHVTIPSLGSDSCAIDLYLGEAYVTTVDVDFYGYFLPFSVPAVGATALASSETVLSTASPAISSVAFVLPAAIDWYRVATEAIFTFYTLMGNIRIIAQEVGGSHIQFWSINVAAINTTVSPVILQQFGGGVLEVFDQARLSTATAGTPYVALDLHLEYAVAATVTIELDGQATLLSTPIAGATALGTGSTVLTYTTS